MGISFFSCPLNLFHSICSSSTSSLDRHVCCLPIRPSVRLGRGSSRHAEASIYASRRDTKTSLTRQSSSTTRYGTVTRKYTSGCLLCHARALSCRARNLAIRRVALALQAKCSRFSCPHGTMTDFSDVSIFRYLSPRPFKISQGHPDVLHQDLFKGRSSHVEHLYPSLHRPLLQVMMAF